jgi:WD40 repeat protein
MDRDYPARYFDSGRLWAMPVLMFAVLLIVAHCSSCAEVEDDPAEQWKSTDIPAAELKVRDGFTRTISTCQNSLLALGYDLLYVWDWTNLDAQPQRKQFDDSWLPLLFSRSIGPPNTNYNYALTSMGHLVYSSHQEDATHIIIQSLETGAEVRRWSFERRWECDYLRNSTNGKFIAVYLREDHEYVLDDQYISPGERRPNSRNDDGRLRVGVIAHDSDEIRWASTIYTRSLAPDIGSVAVSEDGKYIVAVGTDDGGFIHLADAEQKKVLWQKVPHGAEVPHGDWTVCFNDVCFSPDSKRIYVAGNFGLFCFDRATGKILSQWQVRDSLTDIAVTPDGRLVVGGAGNADEAYIYRAKDGKRLLKIITGQGSPASLAISPDGKLLAIPGWTKFGITIWKLPTADSEGASQAKKKTTVKPAQ